MVSSRIARVESASTTARTITSVGAARGGSEVVRVGLGGVGGLAGRGLGALAGSSSTPTRRTVGGSEV